jgi:O-6-methylguanine DNA methyltransferase
MNADRLVAGAVWKPLFRSRALAACRQGAQIGHSAALALFSNADITSTTLDPIGLVVPCRRVIGADGTLTGYGGGIERKRWMLRHEGVAIH